MLLNSTTELQEPYSSRDVTVRPTLDGQLENKEIRDALN